MIQKIKQQAAIVTSLKIIQYTSTPSHVLGTIA